MKKIAEVREELSELRQLYYEVIDQRNAFHDRTKELERELAFWRQAKFDCEKCNAEIILERETLKAEVERLRNLLTGCRITASDHLAASLKAEIDKELILRKQ